jgi:hypothetical protein
MHRFLLIDGGRSQEPTGRGSQKIYADSSPLPAEPPTASGGPRRPEPPRRALDVPDFPLAA